MNEHPVSRVFSSGIMTQHDVRHAIPFPRVLRSSSTIRSSFNMMYIMHDFDMMYVIQPRREPQFAET